MDEMRRKAAVEAARVRGLFSALAGEDELGVVVRATLYLEHEILEFLGHMLPFPDELGQLQFSQRLRIALACGLRKELGKPLKVIADIRNQFAHNLDARVSDKDADRLFASFCSYDKQGLNEQYLAIFDNAKLLTPFRDQSPLSRFSIMNITLWGAIVTETFIARNKEAN